MSRVLIRPSSLRGSLRVPLSKSAAHRALICAALAGQHDVLPLGEQLSEDIIATRAALTVLMEADGKAVSVDCGESGSTLRFLIPVAAALGIPAEFTGRGRLPERPIGVYLQSLPEHGVHCKTEGGLPLRICGKLTSGKYQLPGDVSSQFITGLLLALPLLAEGSQIELTTPLESAGYVDMTVQIMADFGVLVYRSESGWLIPGNQRYRQKSGYEIERDWSQAAFFLAACAAADSRLQLEGMNPDSCQGDRTAESLFQKLGAGICWKNGILIAQPRPEFTEKKLIFDASQIPDLVPALAAAAALLPGCHTVICNAARLRLKESDRLAAMADGLNRLGGRIREMPDGLIIEGVPSLRGGTVSGYNDHRVVMALAVAALKSAGETVITGAESIRKSYPEFFQDYNRLGGKASDLGE